MLIVEHAIDLQRHAGRPIGSSQWFTIEQRHISDFARLTGDDNWIHVDAERAARELPDGKTIAHGLYVLSLIPWLQRNIFAIRRRGRGLNYGYDRVRFLTPVQAGSRIRLTMSLVQATRHAAGARVELESMVDVEGSDKPALIARSIILIEDE
ncbi:MaoC family dehydratase [Pseudorhodoplanes sinuspersici]|uniref:Enoyl-CoA hydratase n=1 Tax=Pseudorhodoplanes sinuspersici TaxID=1235591 RepID=A0A1W6ZK73_9HYPH|nr:MaoC family dehydratase [Pseudorhodoplanes sinuspersici]ARP97655.1 enoyl-CoA hydratase [Pseudorhodoplanes sinuspersici]RKE65680.1 acyl dehydratase [Pseudorhodoplanes sinuspersici]